jgi:fatty-acyl-CoA synthase
VSTSVGRPAILDDRGNELPVGEVGRSTVGDLGHLDDEGYLYLSDRRKHLITSGGVNIYPRENQDLLVVHQAVADVAVLGRPDADLGEKVVAVVELVDPRLGSGSDRGVARILPRSIGAVRSAARVFHRSSARTPTGKLSKHELREGITAL